MRPLALRVPGPTPLPPEVTRAATRGMISHRSADFHALLRDVSLRVARAIGSASPALLLSTSGTGGLEAAIVNTVAAGDTVLSTSIGYFGDRFAQIAETYGAQVDYLRGEPGQPVDLEALQAALRDGKYHAVLVTHCETSTGVLNRLEPIAGALRDLAPDALFLLDGVSSLGATLVDLDALGVDIAVTASQKAWMSPPGLSMITASARAMERAAECSTPRYYLDLRHAQRSSGKDETPWTPALPQLYGLQAALDLIDAEGLAAVAERHRDLATRLRQGLTGLGFRMVAAPGYESPTVTAAFMPEGVGYPALAQRLEADFNLQVSGGQGALRGKVLRVGHMGWVNAEDIDFVLETIGATIGRLGRS